MAPAVLPAVDESVVLRFAHLLPELPAQRLRAVSLGEGIRKAARFEHRGVEVTLIDETSLMASGTFKSVEACVTAALLDGPAVCASGGNTGAALALYARRAGLRVTLVVPADAKLRLHPDCADTPVVAVRDASRLREVAARLGPVVPALDRRYAAGFFRGCAYAELGRPDWVSQTVSAGFGPVGMYRAFGRLGLSPRLLAVQQAENCPFYERWTGKRCETGPLPLPNMYDRDPFAYGSWPEFARLLEKGGAMITVSAAEARRPLPGGFAAGPGTLGLAGVLKAVESGLIPKGAAVWHSMTSGAPCPAVAPANVTFA